jgi:hypothetical protein
MVRLFTEFCFRLPENENCNNQTLLQQNID